MTFLDGLLKHVMDLKKMFVETVETPKLAVLYILGVLNTHIVYNLIQ